MAKWGMIATWRMAFEGVEEGIKLLENGGNSGDAVEVAVRITENNPYYKSVGFGGLPNEHCIVELDAAYMDGDTLAIGAVASIKDFANPISIARRLSKERFNSFLVGNGAENFAHKEGFERKNMLTPRAKKMYERKLEEIKEKNLSPYDGHDTVCILGLDTNKTITAGTSTSGLFMKKSGRVGDSPLSGSGFYADSEIGAAAATGLGEDIMKGCCSYETVRLMEEGFSPQEAAQKVVFDFSKKLKRKYGKAGAISIVAIDKDGNWGVGTNCEFTFVAGNNTLDNKIYIANPKDNSVDIKEVSQEWLAAYEARIKKPLHDL